MADRSRRKLAVILHADVVGSTALVRSNETLAHERIQDAFQRFSKTIDSYGGIAHELRGDALVAEFDRASDAVSAALVFQAENTEFNDTLEDDIQPDLRIGIAMGEVVVADNTITGDGVVLAQRLEQVAESGGVCIQDAAYQTVPKRLPFEYENLGEQQLKGFEDPVRVYAVALRPGEAAPAPEPPARARKPMRLRFVGGVMVFLIIVGGLVAWWEPWKLWVEPAPEESVALRLTDKPFIAVLPFVNMSGEAKQEFFSDGITEDIITELSRFGFFYVISRNSTFTYKGTSVDVSDVARDLGARYIVEGSVRKYGKRVRITAQLIDAVADKHIWAEKYDRELEDVFQVQDEITQSIVTFVAPEYHAAEMRRAHRKETRDLDAWESFMRGYWHFFRFTAKDNAAAQRLIREAIEKDPNQANYHGLLAVIHTMDAFYGWSESRDRSFRVALESAERGLALDDQDAMVIRSAGDVHFFMKNHDVALDYYKRAVEANPNEAENRALLGAALGVAGDYEAAVDQFETAMRLSPRDVHVALWFHNLAIAAFVAGRDEQAAEWSRKTVQANPQFPAGPRTLAASYGNLGRLTEANAAREKLQELLPHLTIAQLRDRLPYFVHQGDLDRYLEGLRKAGLPE